MPLVGVYWFKLQRHCTCIYVEFRSTCAIDAMLLCGFRGFTWYGNHTKSAVKTPAGVADTPQGRASVGVRVGRRMAEE